MKKLKHILEYAAVKLLVLPLWILPLRWSVGIGAAVGRLLWKLGIRRSVSRKNLEICFPDISTDERDRILAESYANFCRSMVEFALLGKYRGRMMDFVDFEGGEKLREIHENGEGCFFVSGHFGSWELMGAALGGYGLPVDFLVGEQSNPAVDRYINRVRASMGIGIIHMGVAARGVLKSIKSGRFVATLSDQDAGKSPVTVKFFGQDAATPAGVAAFARKLKCPIAVGATVRRDDPLNHRIHVEILRPDYDALPDDRREADRLLTQRYTDILEKYVREFPEMYFWAHRRFKSSVDYGGD